MSFKDLVEEMPEHIGNFLVFMPQIEIRATEQDVILSRYAPFNLIDYLDHTEDAYNAKVKVLQEHIPFKKFYFPDRVTGKTKCINLAVSEEIASAMRFSIHETQSLREELSRLKKAPLWTLIKMWWRNRK